jgi:hypothetical protein
MYFEICHYNSSSTGSLPFCTSFVRWGPLSDRICIRILRMDIYPLDDMRAPHISFTFNLQLSGLWALPRESQAQFALHAFACCRDDGAPRGGTREPG